METVNIRKEDILDIEELKITPTISSEGCVIRDPHDSKTALKLFFQCDGTYFSNKLYTINSLIDLKEKVEMPQMVFPEKLLTVDEKAIGFSMPIINGVPLAKVLYNEGIDINTKVKYLKQIGSILEKMAELREENPNLNWYLNDLHEFNFVVDLDKQQIYTVDLDSSRILGNHPFLSKYLSPFSPLVDFPLKYHKEFELSCGGSFLADENSDLYCYAMLTLNFLYGSRINLFNKEDYFAYIDYLKKVGVPQELIDAWAKVYSNDNNINFAPFLDALPYFYDKANQSSYLKRTKNN